MNETTPEINSPPPNRLKMPAHVAIIMDGNGRWAQSRGRNRLRGHSSGAESVKQVLEEARRLGIKYLTLYTFSTENWQRPQREVEGLMKLLADYLERETPTLLANGIRLSAIGDLDRLPAELRNFLNISCAATSANTGLTLTLALSYGGRLEVTQAVRRIAREVEKGRLAPEDIDEQLISSYLWTNRLPDPDLLIRTGGEMRISNFLLWQIAYAELYVTPILWPEFGAEEFRKAIFSYQSRERRFGLTSGQL